MFTGLIEQVGELEAIRTTDVGRELRIRARFPDLERGESVAVNGACLTVRDFTADWFEAAAVLTTLERTAIDDWKKGTRLNLERSLRVGDRLGGHIVQGHVDCVGIVVDVTRRDDAVLVDVSIPASIESLLALHGSVAIDGVSLTVNALKGGALQLSLIDYTLRHTTLGELKAGSRVHVEADVIAKHLRRLLEPYLRENAPLGMSSVADFSLEH